MVFHHYKLFIGLSLTCACVLSYNLDVKSALTFRDPSEPKTKGSYFGFSVVLVSGTSSGSWLLVGAPRGNSTAPAHKSIVEPGVLYKCRIQLHQHNQSCEQYVLDETGNDESPDEVDIQYHDHKDGAWIGAAMDIHSSGDDAEITVCGHRWINEDGKGKNRDFFMLGICYVIYAKDINKSEGTNPGGTKTILVPTERGEMYFYPVPKNAAYYYGTAQAGLSVHYAEPQQGTVLVAGAPGILNWRGGLMHTKRTFYEDSGAQQRRRRDVKGYWTYEEKPQNLTYALKSVAKYFDYFGYQITSGNFFHDLYSYAAASPRGSNLKGNVKLFSVTSHNKIEFTRPATISGTQAGEYFGASMAVADVNGDHIQDLIVGAPMFHKKCEEGRVYIFHGGSTKHNFEQKEAKDGYAEKGRFGTAVSSLGDIDQDGYEDIAVGAPYEGKGIVYIYNGSPMGVKKDYSQRINAEDISPNLRGFGIAVSKPADVDNNHYDDIAVGSFISENVVLLRTHPVVKLRMLLTSKSKYLHLGDSSFTVQLDLWFEGQHVDELDVDYIVAVDDEHKRGFIGQGRENSYQNLVKLKNGYNHTYEILVKLNGSNNGIQSSLEPIEIVMTAYLYRNETETGGNVKKLFPVLHNYDSGNSYTLLVPLSSDCGKNVCYCDLELTTHLKQLSDGVFVTGSSNVLDLEITIVNKADTAYLTTVCIMLPSPVQLDSIPKNCFEPQTSGISDGSNITCNIANVMIRNSKETLTVRLDMTHVTHDFNVSVSVTTPIEDKNLTNNFEEIILRLVTEADVTIAGKDENGEHVYNGEYPRFSVLQHKYEVQKFKQSSVDEVEVIFNVPWLYHVAGRQEPIKLVDIYEPETTQNDKKFYEKLTCSSNIPYKYQFEDLADGESVRIKRSVNESFVESSQDVHVPSLALNSHLYFNCSNFTSNVECRYIKCLTRPFTNNHIIARITLTMEINIADLVPYLGKNGVIMFSTDGSVNITKPAILHEANELTDYATVSTAFYLYAPREKVATNIYILAIIGGLLLLLLLVLGLVKAGFFRRKKKEELKSLLAENVATSSNVEDNCGNHVAVNGDK